MRLIFIVGASLTVFGCAMQPAASPGTEADKLLELKLKLKGRHWLRKDCEAASRAQCPSFREAEEVVDAMVSTSSWRTTPACPAISPVVDADMVRLIVGVESQLYDRLDRHQDGQLRRTVRSYGKFCSNSLRRAPARPDATFGPAQMRLSVLQNSAEYFAERPQARRRLRADLSTRVRRIAEEGRCAGSEAGEAHWWADVIDLRRVHQAVALHLCHIAHFWQTPEGRACSDPLRRGSAHAQRDLLFTLYVLGPEGTRGVHCEPACMDSESNPRGCGVSERELQRFTGG